MKYIDRWGLMRNINKEKLKNECNIQSNILVMANEALELYKVIKHNEANESKKYSLRSSIWKCYDDKWKMIFHQGTLAESF